MKLGVPVIPWSMPIAISCFSLNLKYLSLNAAASSPTGTPINSAIVLVLKSFFWPAISNNKIVYLPKLTLLRCIKCNDGHFPRPAVKFFSYKRII